MASSICVIAKARGQCVSTGRPTAHPSPRFSSRASASPALRLLFPSEIFTNAAETLAFAQPEPTRPVPFGRVIYEDLTFLPGVVTFDLFGHEIELVPRMLVVNRKAIPWRPGAVVEVAREGKSAVPPQPPATIPRKPSLFSPRP